MWRLFLSRNIETQRPLPGFEYFEVNSFEQLCINYANEKLQQHFNRQVFSREQELYRQEGIAVPETSHSDNHDVIELLEQRGTGLFPLLDEQCRMPRSSDQGFCQAAYDKHQGDQRFSAPSSRRRRGHGSGSGGGSAGGRRARAAAAQQRTFSPSEAFVVQHFAGAVTYCVDGFVSKNMDPLPTELQALMGRCAAAAPN
jgi:myosin heavy subunit